MDFLEYLKEIGITTRTEGHHHVRSGWVQFDCPFCSKGSNRFRMGYRIKGGYVNCWTCGRHTLAETIALLADITPRAAYGIIKGFSSLPWRNDEQEQQIRGKLVLPRGVEALRPAHRTYLQNRGYDPDKLVKLWGLEGLGVLSKIGWRIFIPIHHNGKVVSWTSRSLAEKSDIRYHTAKPDEEELNHKELLFGEDYVRNGIVVHEGPFDVFRTGPGATCTFGTQYSRAQVLRISKYPVRVVCFDNHPDAQKQARKLADDLSPFPGETYNVILSGKDADVSPEEEIQTLRKRFLEI